MFSCIRELRDGEMEVAKKGCQGLAWMATVRYGLTDSVSLVIGGARFIQMDLEE